MPAEISGDSPQAVAYKLLEDIAAAEQRNLGGAADNINRDWILETYKDCLATVLSIRRYGPFTG